MLLFTQIFCTVRIPMPHTLSSCCDAEALKFCAWIQSPFRVGEKLSSVVWGGNKVLPTADANNLQCKDPFIRKCNHQLCTTFLSQLMKKDNVWCTVLLPGKQKQQNPIRSYFRECWVTYASWLLLTSDDCSFLPARSILKQFFFQTWFVIFRVYPRDTYCDFSICVRDLLLNRSN